MRLVVISKSQIVFDILIFWYSAIQQQSVGYFDVSWYLKISWDIKPSNWQSKYLDHLNFHLLFWYFMVSWQRNVLSTPDHVCCFQCCQKDLKCKGIALIKWVTVGTDFYWLPYISLFSGELYLAKLQVACNISSCQWEPLTVIK